jgi:mannose-1-phosphate guanylyltransferase/mannose-6-phosphate isomerase
MNIALLCGGSGTRLWPLSRTKLPKQFLPLVNDKTMFQNTILRFQHLKTLGLAINKYIIICNKEHEFMVNEQIHDLHLSDDFYVVCEPIGRDSAPAVCIASLCGCEDTTTLIVPCDHIFNDYELCALIKRGVEKYLPNSIITFGISPSYPETGYGYIHTNECNETLRFKEKPDYTLAKQYIEDGCYLWNAGLFLFQNKTMIQCFQEYAPDILNTCKDTLNHSDVCKNTTQLNGRLFETCKSISIDYAIMEPLTNCLDSSLPHIKAFTLTYDHLWSDIGSFKALFDQCEKNESNNVLKGDILTQDTTNCYIESDSAVVATLGLDNIIVVNHRDVLLVMNKDNSQDLKKLIGKISDKHADLKIVHTKAFRPWGWYKNIEGNDHSGYKVKRICVYPGKRLSLQSHNHRSEHWVICTGKARVQLNDDFIVMNPNEHIYIPAKALHRMENMGDEVVEFIETQIGDYLGEDDIIRYQDDFGRT